jgi:hypothetical protein
MLSFSLNKVIANSIYYIITCNNLEKDHAFATHKFQVLGWDIFSQYWYLLTHTNKSATQGYCCSFHLVVFQVSYPQGNVWD